MPRPCTVCTHHDLKRITEDLMRRTPYRVIQGRYGVSKSSLERHVSQHVSKALRRLTSSEMSLADAGAIAQPVLVEMRALNARTLRILADAEGAEDRTTALHAIRECRRNLELIAKLTGELDPRAAGESSGSPLTVIVQYVDKAAVVLGDAPAATVLPEAARLNSAPPGANTGTS